jgi:hypothetical protein
MPPPPSQRRARQADSTDPISTFLTRRFGLAGGLAWLAVLTFGVVSEQLKTRAEVAREESGTQAVNSVEVTTASGLRYRDTVRGGGEMAPQRGYLLAADVRVTLADDVVLFDTASTGRPLAFFFGCGTTRCARALTFIRCTHYLRITPHNPLHHTSARPFQGALCPGVEEGVAGMRAGGTRIMVVPPEIAFPAGAKFPGGEVPPGSTLTYTVKLLRVSVPPS